MIYWRRYFELAFYLGVHVGMGRLLEMLLKGNLWNLIWFPRFCFHISVSKILFPYLFSKDFRLQRRVGFLTGRITVEFPAYIISRSLIHSVILPQSQISTSILSLSLSLFRSSSSSSSREIVYNTLLHLLREKLYEGALEFPWRNCYWKHSSEIG